MPGIIFLFITAGLLAALLFFLLKFFSNRKKIAALSIAKINYETICREANDAMLVIDIVDGRIYKTNPALAAMLGYSLDQLEHLSLFDLHPENMLDKSSEVIADVWEKGGMVYQHIPFVKADRELLSVECSAKVMRYANRPAVLIYARDITERLKMEKEIREQKKLIEEKNKEIIDSINYARRIQRGTLPQEETLKKCFENFFVLYKPKDIVSGDFYWGLPSVNRNTNTKLGIIATVDCTGHGVPGAFMSMLGNTLLNQTIYNPDIVTAADVLNYLNRELPQNLKSTGNEITIRDGMDMALCIFEFPSPLETGAGVRLNFAGANNPCWIIRENQLIELKADKQAISAGTDMEKHPFIDHIFNLQKNDAIYLFTDGYADQFGGPKGKKFKYSQLEKLLLSIQNKSMSEQREILNDTIEKWKGNLEQLDDICIIGVRV